MISNFKNQKGPLDQNTAVRIFCKLSDSIINANLLIHEYIYTFKNVFLAKCKTALEGEHPQKGVKCVFPFTYDGITYNGCIPGKSPWCSTKGIII